MCELSALSLNEGIKFLAAQVTAPALFGHAAGDALRALAIKWNRVLVWALGGSSDGTVRATDTRVVDPVVLWNVTAGGNISMATWRVTNRAFEVAWQVGSCVRRRPNNEWTVRM